MGVANFVAGSLRANRDVAPYLRVVEGHSHGFSGCDVSRDSVFGIAVVVSGNAGQYPALRNRLSHGIGAKLHGKLNAVSIPKRERAQISIEVKQLRIPTRIGCLLDNDLSAR